MLVRLVLSALELNYKPCCQKIASFFYPDIFVCVHVFNHIALKSKMYVFV